MDTERCRVLLLTLEQGSLTAVAEKLGYTTSGLSRMMDALEAETGFPLLVRTRNGITPTRECETLLPLMKELVRTADRYSQTASEILGFAAGSIRIGTSYYAYYDWFAGIISDFRKLYPGIRVEIAEGTSTELLHKLEEHSVDLCIISKRDGKCDWIPLETDELLACLPADHPLARADRFPVSAFAKEDYIELYPGKESDNSRMLKKNGVVPKVCYTTSDNYAAYAMVAAGLGISCTNAILGEGFIGGVSYLPLDPPEYVEIGIALQPEKELSPAAKRFTSFALKRFRH